MLAKPQINFRNVGIPTALCGTLNLSNDQEQVPLLHHVVHEHKIEKKPKISECFVVTFVEQPSYDDLDICEDKWLNKISASINKHRIILPRIK